MDLKNSLYFCHPPDSSYQSMFHPGELVTAAVSGGPDSVAMLYTLLEICRDIEGLRIQVAHFNHQLRREADEEEAFVAALASRLSLEFYSRRCDSAEYAATHRLNLEAAARSLRYQFLAEVCDQTGSTVVTTGHNLNDQAETILFRLTRGTGSEGLAGIRRTRPLNERVRIVRPLLHISRRDIEAYLHQNGYEYVLDQSNLSVDLSRNRIRHQVIPILEIINPEAVANIVRSASLASQHLALSLPDLQVHKLYNQPTYIVQMAIREAIKKAKGNLYGVSALHIQQVMRLLEPGSSGKSISIPGGFKVVRVFDRLEVVADRPVSSDPTILERGQTGHFGSFLVAYGTELEGAEYTAEVNYSGQLQVRGRRLGESFRTLRHSRPKKLKDLMIAARIPVISRDLWPIFADADGSAIWIPSIGIAAKYSPDASSEAVKLSAKHLGKG